MTLVILRVPRYQGETSDIPYTTVPLGIIQTDRVVVTVCSFESDLIRGLTNGRVRNLSTSKRNRFLLHIFLVAAQQYLTYLRAINKTVDVLEDKLQLSLRNREVLELLKYQKSLTYFTTALKANELMMARLQKSQLFRMYPDDEDLLEDALTEIGQAIEMTNISSGILSAMMDAFASIISNNLNVVMKFLASVTIILALPSLVASIYGMNVDLPLGSPSAGVLVRAGVGGGRLRRRDRGLHPQGLAVAAGVTRRGSAVPTAPGSHPASPSRQALVERHPVAFQPPRRRQFHHLHRLVVQPVPGPPVMEGPLACVPGRLRVRSSVW